MAGMFLITGLILSAVLAGLILNDLRHRTSLESARSYASMLTVFRDYYSSVVVGSARKNGTPISPQYHNIDGAIPPPATMTIEIGLWMQDMIEPGSFRWFSEYPFLSRGSGGPRSAFEREAVDVLSDRTTRNLTRIEAAGSGGGKVLRYAEPITMGKICVECHNSHPDSPRRDWKVGDVRGVQVVSVAMPPLLPSPTELFQEDRGLFVSVALLFLGLVAVTIVLLALMNRLRRAVEVADRRNRQLATAQQAAQLAADTKTRIMANVSRELRRPMNTIAGSTQLINAQAFGPLGHQRYREEAGAAHESAQSLMSIMENMVLMSELDSGDTALKEQAVDTGREIQRILGLMGAEAGETGVQVEAIQADGWPMISTDLRAFRQIITNLAGNAVRHAGRGASLRVMFDANDRSVTFTMIDDGKGMTQKDLQDILQPFHNDETVKTNGIGLGLAVSRELAALLGGSLKITTAAGDGLRADLDFPASKLIGVLPQQSGPPRKALDNGQVTATKKGGSPIGRRP